MAHIYIVSPLIPVLVRRIVRSRIHRVQHIHIMHTLRGIPNYVYCALACTNVISRLAQTCALFLNKTSKRSRLRGICLHPRRGGTYVIVRRLSEASGKCVVIYENYMLCIRSICTRCPLYPVHIHLCNV